MKKNNYKNLIRIVGILSIFSFLVLGSGTVSASVKIIAPENQNIIATTTGSNVFNSDALDFDTVRVSNYTQNPNSSTSWAHSVNAAAGEIVSVNIYYHNSSNATATGTKIRISPQTSSASTSVTFTGSVEATNLNSASGSATVNLTSSQTLTFIPGSIVWYPAQSDNSANLLNGQNGSEVFGSGLAIGDIASGWSTQGSIVARFQVSNINNNNNQNNSNLSVTTNLASNIGENSVTLNGYVNPSTPNTTAAAVSFQYGTNQNSLTIGTSPIDYYTPGSISRGISGLSANTTYYFKACATDSGGQVCGSVLSFTTAGINNNNNNQNNSTTNSITIVTSLASGITENSASLNANFSNNSGSVNTYFEYGTTSSLGNMTSKIAHAASLASFSQTQYISGLLPNTTYYMRGVAEASQGLVYGQTLSFTTLGQTVIDNSVAPIALTSPATSVTKSSATLNGLVINNSNASATHYFEYGKTSMLGQTTPIKTISANYRVNIHQAISGLESETVYFFRLVTQNEYGVSRGDIISLETKSPTNTTTGTPVVTVATTTTTTPTTGSSKNSLIALKIENKYENIPVGDIAEYTITYKNISAGELQKVVLQVIIPEELQFVKASNGVFSAKDNTLSVYIGNLASKQEGTITFQAKALKSGLGIESIVVNASMIYTKTTGVQENAFAYVINKIVENNNNNNLGAAALFGDGSFLPNTLVGWVVLLAAIFALVYLGRKFYIAKAIVSK